MLRGTKFKFGLPTFGDTGDCVGSTIFATSRGLFLPTVAFAIHFDEQEKHPLFNHTKQTHKSIMGPKSSYV